MSDNKCFVIMPYGKRPDADGKRVDFDKVYSDLIHQALHNYRGLDVVRCDDIEQSGWIHQRMIEHILEARLAIVDTSTLNANVFYELGVRHALRKSATVLIHRKGTTFPFNIQGMSSMLYENTTVGFRNARRALRRRVVNSLDGGEVDSLVHVAVPDLAVTHGPPRQHKRIHDVETHTYRVPETKARVAIVTGDYRDIDVAEVWVNSENTAMQMDSIYGKSTSAVIRYLGREKQPDGRVVDSIQLALDQEMNGRERVDPLDVLVTNAGALTRTNGVKMIVHVASVHGEPGEGFAPIRKVHRCVAQALIAADDAKAKPKSIMMPVFGTGPGGGDLKEHARHHLESAIQFLQRNVGSSIETVYFYAFNDVTLETFQALMTELDLAPE